MKKALAAAALAAAVSVAQAQAQADRPVRGIVGIGLTYGGETLAEVEYNNGWRERIKSGGLALFHAGIQVRLGDRVDLQGTVGYHVDDSSARNGGLRFSRYPVELIAMFRVTGPVRIGAGLQHVGSAKLAGSGDLDSIAVSYRGTTGPLAEVEYQFWPGFGVKGRVVSQKYRPSGGGERIDGSHLGVLLNYYF